MLSFRPSSLLVFSFFRPIMSNPEVEPVASSSPDVTPPIGHASRTLPIASPSVTATSSCGSDDSGGGDVPCSRLAGDVDVNSTKIARSDGDCAAYSAVAAPCAEWALFVPTVDVRIPCPW